MKDYEFSAMVSAIVKVCREYHDHQSLRMRIATEAAKYLKQDAQKTKEKIK